MTFKACSAAVVCLYFLLSGQLTSFKTLYSCKQTLKAVAAEPGQHQCRGLAVVIPSTQAHPCTQRLPTQQQAGLA